MPDQILKTLHPDITIKAQVIPYRDPSRKHTIWPGVTQSVNSAGVAKGDQVWASWQHGASHPNAWHAVNGVPTLNSDPAEIHLHQRRIMPGSTAAKKNGHTSGAMGRNEAYPNGWTGISGTGWHPDFWRTGQPGLTTYYRGGTSLYYVPSRRQMEQGAYLHAPPSGTGVILRTQRGGNSNQGKPVNEDGVSWEKSGKKGDRDPAKGGGGVDIRVAFRGPERLRQGHRVGEPVDSDDIDSADGVWYEIPHLQMLVKPSIPGLRRLEDLVWGAPDVAPHGEYIWAYTPMPDGMPSLLQQLLDLGPNWGHELNVMRGLYPDMPTVHTPRKIHGVKVLCRNHRVIGLPLQHQTPWPPPPSRPEPDPAFPPPVVPPPAPEVDDPVVETDPPVIDPPVTEDDTVVVDPVDQADADRIGVLAAGIGEAAMEVMTLVEGSDP